MEFCFVKLKTTDTMKKTNKDLSPKEVLEAVQNCIKAEYLSALKQGADHGAKLALEIINGSTQK